MRKIIIVLFLIFTLLILYGFWIKPDNLEYGHLFIGLGISGGIFIVMPLFLYHRWNKRDVKDYMLTKDSFKKMREFESTRDKLKREKKEEYSDKKNS